MEKYSAKDKQIFDDMKQCVKDLGLKIIGVQEIEGILSGVSIFQYLDYNLGIIFSYEPKRNIAQIFMRYADFVNRHAIMTHL